MYLKNPDSSLQQCTHNYFLQPDILANLEGHVRPLLDDIP
jgi:hypothetical protein